jgi:hypothetical protein
MNLEGIYKQLSMITKIFDAIWEFIATRWWKLIVLLLITSLGYFVYMVYEELQKDVPYIIETYEEVDADGNTYMIDVWSDGTETESINE